MGKQDGYPKVKESEIYDYQLNAGNLKTIEGVLSFPILEEKIHYNFIEITAFEKTFWSKKQVAYLKLELIDEVITIEKDKNEISNGSDNNSEESDNEDSKSVKATINIFLGFEFKSIYSNYTKIGDEYYDLGVSRKKIINYGWLQYYINVYKQVYSGEHDKEDKFSGSLKWMKKSLKIIKIDNLLDQVFTQQFKE